MDWVNKHLQIVPINTFIDPIFPVENAIITHAHADHAKPVSYTHLRAHET